MPKGWAEPNLSPPDLAAKEAYEEAGIIGEVASVPLGTYRYRKRLKDGRQVRLEVGVFAMRVDLMLVDWPEVGQRERRWFRPGAAAKLVQEQGLAALLRRAKLLGGSAS